MNLNRILKTRIALVLLLLVGILSNSQAQNPIVQTNYTADAASLVHNNRFYIYAGRDQAAPNGNWFSMREWRIYSSADMVNWTDHGPKLKVTDFKWASGDAWASQCIYHKGKFYWYVSVSKKFNCNLLNNRFLEKENSKWVTIWKRANCFRLLWFTSFK